MDEESAGQVLSEMVQISRIFRAAGQRQAGQSLTGTKFGFLQYLRHCDARLGELAHQLHVSASVASRVIESLEGEGLVQRRTDPQDARAFLISITASGRTRLGESESSTVRRFAEALDDWSTADAEQAVGILRRLNLHLAEVIEAPDTTRTAPSRAHAPYTRQPTATDDESDINA